MTYSQICQMILIHLRSKDLVDLAIHLEEALEEGEVVLDQAVAICLYDDNYDFID